MCCIVRLTAVLPRRGAGAVQARCTSDALLLSSAGAGGAVEAAEGAGSARAAAGGGLGSAGEQRHQGKKGGTGEGKHRAGVM